MTNRLTTATNKLLNDFKTLNGNKKAIWGGKYTKAFIKWNNEQLLNGKTNIIAYDNNKVFNKQTNKVVNKLTFITLKGNIRKKYENDYVVKDDVILYDPMGILNIQINAPAIPMKYVKLDGSYDASKIFNLKEVFTRQTRESNIKKRTKNFIKAFKVKVAGGNKNGTTDAVLMENIDDSDIYKLRYRKSFTKITQPVIMEETPLLSAGILDLDGEFRNDEWCKNRNMCVVDFIQFRYGKTKGFIKITTDDVVEKIATNTYEKQQSYGNTYIYDLLTNEILYDEDDDGNKTEPKKLPTNPNKTGYLIQHIINWCEYAGVSMYALHENKIIKKYIPNKLDTKNKPLVFSIKNNHLYPVIDNRKIRQITHYGNGNYNNINSDTHMKTEKQQKKTILPVKYVKNHNATGFELMGQIMEEQNTMVYPAENATMLGDNGLTKFTLNNTLHIIEKSNDNDVIKNYYGNDYQGESEINILNDLTIMVFKEPDDTDKNNEYYEDDEDDDEVKEVKVLDLIPKSYYNVEIQDALSDKKIKHRTHLGLCSETAEYEILNGNTKCWDINKCYRACMEQPQGDFMTIDFNSQIHIRNEYDNEFGLWFIETNDMTILHGSNWYCNESIEYALENNINMTFKYFINGIRCKDNPLKKIIDTINENFEDNNDLVKLLINIITGYTGKTEAKHTNISIDTDLNRVWDTFYKNQALNDNKDFVFTPYQGKDKTYYFYGKTLTTKLVSNSLPIYIQLLDWSNIRLHKMITKMGGKLLYRKTDMAITSVDKIEIPKEKLTPYTLLEEHTKLDKLITNMGGKIHTIKDQKNNLRCDENYEDEYIVTTTRVLNEDFSTYTEVEEVENYKKLKHIPQEEFNDNIIGGYKSELLPKYFTEMKPVEERNVEFTYKQKEWVDFRPNDSDEYEEIKNILHHNGGLLLLGRAGTGKTYVAKKICDGLRCKKIAFTNKASLILGGETIHKFLRISSDGKIVKKYALKISKEYDLIVVDEISMINSDLWILLTELKQLTNLPFLLLGDYRQLPPIEDEKKKGEKKEEIDYFNHSNIQYLTNYGRVELNVMKRYDLPLWNKLEEVVAGKYVDIKTKTFTPSTFTDFLICYTNSTRKQINTTINQYISKIKQHIMIPYKGEENKYNQDIILYEGLKLICDKTIKVKGEDENKISKNEIVYVVEYPIDGTLKVKSSLTGKITEHLIEDLHKTFLLGYITTTHKAQGETAGENQRVIIFDWDEMIQNKKLLYTALSRATKLENCYKFIPTR